VKSAVISPVRSNDKSPRFLFHQAPAQLPIIAFYPSPSPSRPCQVNVFRTRVTAPRRRKSKRRKIFAYTTTDWSFLLRGRITMVGTRQGLQTLTIRILAHRRMSQTTHYKVERTSNDKVCIYTMSNTHI
jgi:hypothetical protein